MQSMITINRVRNYNSKIRFYEIILDGNDVGMIFDGRSVSIPTDPGTHTLKLKLDWGGSKEINFSLNEDGRAIFECQPNNSLLFILALPYHLLFNGFDEWIILKQIA